MLMHFRNIFPTSCPIWNFDSENRAIGVIYCRLSRSLRCDMLRAHVDMTTNAMLGTVGVRGARHKLSKTYRLKRARCRGCIVEPLHTEHAPSARSLRLRWVFNPHTF
jgi:hypothetical protein